MTFDEVGGLSIPVAIVGMGCRLPGGINSPSAFWELLSDNRDAIGEVPAERWKSYTAKGSEFARSVRGAIRFGGYLDDIAGFDADFFGISPREAELMDPQQRVTMEVAWEALEHAGIAPSGLAGTDASVFMGVCTDDYGRRLLAISAAPSSTVFSGGSAAIEQLAEELRSEGLIPRRVNTDVAFHSTHMDALVPELLTALADVTPRSTDTVLYTTALDDPRAEVPRDAAYWAANLRNPVRFHAAVQAAAADGHRVFLEVSTHPVVAHSIMETLPDAVVVPTLRRDQPERETLLANLGTLHCHGVPIDWHTLHPATLPAELPTTAWQHRHFWVDPPASGRAGHDVERHTVLGEHVLVQTAEPVSLWQTRVDYHSRPYPGGHAVLGTEILPAAVTLTTFLAAGGTGAIKDVVLRVPISVTAPRELQVISQDGSLQLSSRLTEETDDTAWLTHATAQVADPPAAPGRLPLGSVSEVLDPGCVMDRLSAIEVVGIGWPWEVLEASRGRGHLIVRVAADPNKEMAANTWASLFDAGLSAAPVLFPGAPRLRMPGRLRALSVHGEPPAEALIGVRLVDVEWTGTVADAVVVDVWIADLDGNVAATLHGAHFGVVQAAARPAEVETDGTATDWLTVPESELDDRVELSVRAVIGAELRMDPGDIDSHRPLSEMGVDSLLAESIRQLLGREFRLALPSTLLWDRPSVAAVARHVAGQLRAAGQEPLAA